LLARPPFWLLFEGLFGEPAPAPARPPFLKALAALEAWIVLHYLSFFSFASAADHLPLFLGHFFLQDPASACSFPPLFVSYEE
jgi:hypothetical protein